MRDCPARLGDEGEVKLARRNVEPVGDNERRLKRPLPLVAETGDSGSGGGAGAPALIELLKPNPWLTGRARLKLLSLESEPLLLRVGFIPELLAPQTVDEGRPSLDWAR